MWYTIMVNTSATQSELAASASQSESRISSPLQNSWVRIYSLGEKGIFSYIKVWEVPIYKKKKKLHLF